MRCNQNPQVGHEVRRKPEPDKERRVNEVVGRTFTDLVPVFISSPESDHIPLDQLRDLLREAFTDKTVTVVDTRHGMRVDFHQPKDEPAANDAEGNDQPWKD
jgi:hypothetical protein